jgi:myosin III
LEKNPEHRPYSVELIEHPFISAVPDNDYHVNMSPLIFNRNIIKITNFQLTQELKQLVNEFGEIGKNVRRPERLIKDGMLQSETNPEPEVMHVEDLAALEKLTEDTILNELTMKMEKGSFQSFIGDVLLTLNPNCENDIYNAAVRQRS